jgi:predicted  nucleic acid-binding Zn-ribbon protein
MEQGLVSNPKDLERMQGELVSLQRRISDLEDVELEVMENLETAQAELDDLVGRLEQLDSRAADLTDVELADLAGRRKTLADGLAGDLVALYDRLRQQKGGVGAAALRARRCGGCSLELTAADLAVIAKAPSDEVLRCEECNRILVRTSESGV